METDQPAYKLSKELIEILDDDAGTVQQLFNKFHHWMLLKGKDPDKGDALAKSTTNNYCDRLDQLFRLNIYLTNPKDRTIISHDDADLLIKWLNEDEIQKDENEPYSENGKRKFANTLQKYHTWREKEGMAEEEWTPNITFSQSHYESADKLNFEERWKVREAALEYGSLPSYASVSPRERERIKGLVAQRLGKPKEEVSKKDWERADQSTKIGSLIAVALDTGITPTEVTEARTSWYNQSKGVLEIPSEYSSKNRPTAELPLTENTQERLSRWIQERRFYQIYDGTDRLWLNQKGNPYDSGNLCYLLRRLCEAAGIEHDDRNIIWYSLRHNVGQTIKEVEDLGEASDQLRHQSYETTQNIYAESAIESRRTTLERINEKARRKVEESDFNPWKDGQSEARYPDETTQSSSSAVTTTKTVHVDAVIEDSAEARNDLIQEILSQQNDSG